RLRARSFAAPVLVVDLDLHDGNGTRAVFAADPSVHTFSIHNRTWDDAPAASATVIALGEGVTDERYLAVLRDALPPVVERHRPGMVVYIAGADPAAAGATPPGSSPGSSPVACSSPPTTWRCSSAATGRSCGTSSPPRRRRTRA